MAEPQPSALPAPTDDPDVEAIGYITILMFDWVVGGSEVRLKLPPEAEPGQPNALALQTAFRTHIVADLDAALAEFGGP